MTNRGAQIHIKSATAPSDTIPAPVAGAEHGKTTDTLRALARLLARCAARQHTAGEYEQHS